MLSCTSSSLVNEKYLYEGVESNLFLPSPICLLAHFLFFRQHIHVHIHTNERNRQRRASETETETDIVTDTEEGRVYS